MRRAAWFLFRAASIAGLIAERMDFDAITENVSWATVRCEPTLDSAGRDVAVVVAKLAYKVAPNGSSTLAFRPVRFTAAPDGHGAVKYPAENADQKPGTDVGLVGTAHPPPGKPVDKMLAWVQAGLLRKVVTVHGPRRFIAASGGATLGPSAPLEPTPLRFDHCYGGTEHTSPTHESEPWNPRGRGFALEPRSLIGKEAPVLEPASSYRGDPLAAAHRSHGCFAPIPEMFEPRRRLAGTHDATWARTRAPIRPKDFDVAHHAWAMPELHSSKPLPPDTAFEVGGVTPEGVWRFKLPQYWLEFESTIAGDARALSSHLDSVLIDADERVVELAFRAAIVLPRKWAMLDRIVVRGMGDMPKACLATDEKKDVDAKSTTQGGGRLGVTSGSALARPNDQPTATGLHRGG